MKKIIIFYLLLLITLSLQSCGSHKGKRVGAICKDGWRSSATGSGACSGHGGVDHWLYEGDTK